MQSFNVPVGRTRRIGATPAGAGNEPESVSDVIGYTSSDPTIATATVNAGAGGGVQVDVKGIAAGVVTITASAPDSETPPVTVTDQFQVNVTSPATHFLFADLGLVG